MGNNLDDSDPNQVIQIFRDAIPNPQQTSSMFASPAPVSEIHVHLASGEKKSSSWVSLLSAFVVLVVLACGVLGVLMWKLPPAGYDLADSFSYVQNYVLDMVFGPVPNSSLGTAIPQPTALAGTTETGPIPCLPIVFNKGIPDFLTWSIEKSGYVVLPGSLEVGKCYSVQSSQDAAVWAELLDKMNVAGTQSFAHYLAEQISAGNPSADPVWVLQQIQAGKADGVLDLKTS